MEIQGWDERYKSGARRAEDLDASPTPLLMESVEKLSAGSALDLACGSGRNALWLAEQGWSVTAVNGSPVALEILQSRASEGGIKMNAKVADLEKFEYRI